VDEIAASAALSIFFEHRSHKDARPCSFGLACSISFVWANAFFRSSGREFSGPEVGRVACYDLERKALVMH